MIGEPFHGCRFARIMLSSVGLLKTLGGAESASGNEGIL